ncbi:phage holin, lambda family [Enterobacterales bacterium CwR94]|nr:phage holin, lambda family [Enterobacterales bacterium CwR94]
MSANDPGFWATLIAWLYAHKNEWGYAGLAGVMALIRASYFGRDSWPRRLMDAAMCSMFAFFVKPTLLILASIFNWQVGDDAAWVAAILIGFTGIDYFSFRIRKQLDKRFGGESADQ